MALLWDASWRPMLRCLTCRVCGQVDEHAWPTATMAKHSSKGGLKGEAVANREARNAVESAVVGAKCWTSHQAGHTRS